MQFSPDLICTIDEQCNFIELSDACKSFLGYDSKDLIGQPFVNYISFDEQRNTLELFKNLIKGKKNNKFQNRHLHKTGRLVSIDWVAAWSEEEKNIFCIGRLNSEDTLTSPKNPVNSDVYKLLIEQGSDMLSLLDEQGNYTYTGGSTTKILGYAPEQLLGKNAFQFIHPEDIGNINELWSQLDSYELLQTMDFRFRAANGEWRWLEATANNQFKNPEINALVISSRDITERKISRLKLEESEQRFKSLFENNPDLVLFENTEGIIEDVNQTVEISFGFQRHEFINRPLSDFLPASVVAVCQVNFQKAMRGEPVRFELELDFEAVGKRILDVSKVPVVVEGEIKGVYTIAKDITAVTQSYNIIKQQAKKLNTIFESITDAFFTLDRDWNFTYINSEFDRLLHTDRSQNIGKNIWEVFPEEVNSIYYRHYKTALETGITTHFEAFLARKGLWLEVKAFPSEEGLSVYFSDISYRIKAQEELERLSVVASKTHNGVIITNKRGKIEWVNESLTLITEYTAEELTGKTVSALLTDAGTSKEVYRQTLGRLLCEDSFEAELPFTCKSGRDLWLMVGVTIIRDKEGSVSRYIGMLSDITPQKQAILERNNFIEELQSRNQSLHQFTHVVSHKLRAPVANILGLAALFELPGIDDKTKAEIVKKIGTASHNLDEIIRDLNHVLTVRESLGLQKTELLFSEMLDIVVQRMHHQIEEAQVHIRRDFTQAPLINTVEQYLLDIIHNLISNALKYRSAERKSVIEVYTRLEENFTVMFVKDNGMGFDLAKHEKNVFGLYKRFHAHVNGKGLGLYLVKTQVEALGGKVEVQSEAGKGSIFKVSFRQNN
ncbi:PAS/PAC sensor signal transduction histidine kinase [Flammeovirgaceae bacterium 311]|nr:PAS/PAC sensor signal transduction histidine kinase [Flammeovirgaceae bacterium 311]